MTKDSGSSSSVSSSSIITWAIGSALGVKQGGPGLMAKTVISWEDVTNNAEGRKKNPSVFHLQLPKISTWLGQSSSPSCPVEIECVKQSTLQV